MKSYEGDFSNIVGFPLPPIIKALARRALVDDDPVLHRLAYVRGRVAAAAEGCGRSASEITLVGAAKRQPVEVVDRLYQLGVRHFGESYVQEYLAKFETLPRDIQWHFIGHLQRNKVRHLVPGLAMLQTVDSVRLGESLAKRATQAGTTVLCLIQVNLCEEPTKSGIKADEVSRLLERLRSLESLDIAGLMAIPPQGGLSASRRWFRSLRSLRDQLATVESPLPELSMGMSKDFDGAIVEGATMIRLGTILFGPRALPKRD